MTEPAVTSALPVAPEPTAESPKMKLPEDLNLEIYSKLFDKCLVAAESLVSKRLRTEKETERQKMTLDVAKTIFERFYNDQNAMKQGKQQAEAMLHGLTQVLEGRR